MVTGTTPITTNNKSLNTLIELLGEDNSFIQRFKPLIDDYYTAIQEKDKKVNTEFFDKKIETLLDLIINTGSVDITDIETADITKLRTIVINLIDALSTSGLIGQVSNLE